MWAIIVGEYSSWDIVGVTDEKDLAEAVAKIHDGYVMNVEKITDESYIQKADELILETHIHLNRMLNRYTQKSEDVVTSIGEKYVSPDEKKTDTVDLMGRYDIYLYDEHIEREKAKKIAFDRIAKYKAKKAGL